MIFFHRHKNPSQKGFTIVELIVSVTIFAFMTAFLVAKYGNFNQSVLLTNLAYDVALTLRNAQSYGLNVKSAPTATENYSPDFTLSYGVHFDKTSSGNPVPRTQMIFFVDDGDGAYETGEVIVSKFTLRNGSYVSGICAGASDVDCHLQPQKTVLDVSFKRPDPSSIILADGVAYQYAEITVSSANGSPKKISIRKSGQIAVLH